MSAKAIVVQHRGRSLVHQHSALLLLIGAVSLPGCGAAADGEWAEGEETASVEQDLQVCPSVALPRASATASSTESASYGPQLAIDGNASTRWASAFSDPQWLRVDLGSQRQIGRVVISWEAASSSAYSIQVSNDGSTWTTVASRTSSVLGARTDTITGLDARARYVRMLSTQRSTAWGNSIYEFQVFGDSDSACASYRIESVHSGKAIDVAGVSTADGASIHQWTYGGGNNQKWILVPKGNSQYQLKSVHSGKCIDIGGASTANGAKAVQWSCHEGLNQRFTLNNVGKGQYTIRAAHSHKCLDVADGSTADGGSIQVWDCASNNNQKWRITDLATSTSRKWASYDANGDSAWNWSTTVSTPGGSTAATGNQWGDVGLSGDDLYISFNHTGTYAAANVTTGYGPEGVEAQSEAERNAGKAVNPNGTLSFIYKYKLGPTRLKLIDSNGGESRSVRVTDYLSNCAFNDCDANIPLSSLAQSGFNFGAVKSVTFFVDASVPAGFYQFYATRIVFKANGDRIDLTSDPNNCGSVGRSCDGGACRDGACQGTVVVNDAVCGTAMAANDSHVWLVDQQNLYRYDISGANKTLVASNIGSASSLIRDGNRLFWPGSNGTGGAVYRLNDGASVPTALWNGYAQQLHLVGSALIASNYESSVGKYLQLDPNWTGPGTPTVISQTAGYGMYSAATPSHIYYYYANSSGVNYLQQIDRATKAEKTITSDYVSHLSAFGDTVYWTYSSSAGGGIRRLSSAAGATVQEAVLPVPSNQSYGAAYADSSGIYYSWHDGVSTQFYRTPHNDSKQRLLVSKTTMPYQTGAGVTLTSNNIVWAQACSRGGPGFVMRMRKP